MDIRKQSNTFGQVFSKKITSEKNLMIWIPEGFAHGFKSLTDDALTYYLVSSEYNKEHDTGIRFDTIGYDWKTEHPIISERDVSFAAMQNFESPF